ncbi:MAG: signal recognition particle-docking protein FtsY [Bacteriovoracaceae bacterium]|nr:signal recognition particle-docking protein FtsY [Bacteriovoracaceae bacterium]
MSFEVVYLLPVAVIIPIVFIFLKRKNKKTLPVSQKEMAPVPDNWSERLVKGLARSRDEIWSKLGQIIGGNKLDSATLEKIEELLYTTDMGHILIAELIEHLKANQAEDIKLVIFNFLNSKMSPVQNKLSKNIFEFTPNSGLKVIMIAGVNGAGKTTTIGKLATKLKRQGAKVYVGACDTFRAAAVEQLQVWCERAGVELIRAAEGADPSGVAYETVLQAKNAGADYCLLDTAGRLHTAKNLMEELKKTKRVMAKVDAQAPHETLLVIDAITGQNALKQAKEFNEALELTGLILTKCDGSAKAGNAVSIVDALKIPITYIGVGETVEDLNVFNQELYLKALVGINA